MGTDIMKVVAILLLLVTIGVPISTADQAEGQSLKRAGEQLFGLIEKANEKVIGAVKEACEQAFNAVWTLIKEFGIRGAKTADQVWFTVKSHLKTGSVKTYPATEKYIGVYKVWQWNWCSAFNMTR